MSTPVTGSASSRRRFGGRLFRHRTGCPTVLPVVHIAGWVQIAAPVERVFDVVADYRNEPSFNPAMTAVELLTPAG